MSQSLSESESVTVQGSAVQELLDMEAIRAAVLRYCRGVDRADADLLQSAYHDDAVDEHGMATFEGHQIGPGIIEVVSRSRISLHQVTNQVIVLHGPDRAGSETYFTAWQSMDQGGEEWMLIALGRYVDRFEKRAGEWRIAHRLVVVDYTNLLAPNSSFPASREGLGRRDGQDPSYAVLSGS